MCETPSRLEPHSNFLPKCEVLRDKKVFDQPFICRQGAFRWCIATPHAGDIFGAAF